ncbi:Putative membrane protein [Methanosarcina barkeri str. Wiesmoor]|uniref:Flavinylation-associated cytochrome domain-containing protein n=3 Tax=Methanosarcina barkeri TaxID=2208 RepID=Q46ED5_METBF|nr:Putative membrane protein [Methanosarcina barkeri str. Wiesmoor]
MTRKLLIKLTIDLFMTVLMLAAMAYNLTGNMIHELLGVSLFALFIVHSILNRRWYQTVIKRKHNTRRVLNTAVNLLLFVMMLMLLVSSVLVSRSLFAFIPVDGGLIARQIHILAAYWGFILISIHLGMHWGMIIGMVQRIPGIPSPNRGRTFAVRVMAVLIAVYGVYAFFERGVGSKLILYYTYSYWNFDESAMFFFTDYLSIMGVCICVTYYVLKFVQNRKMQRLSMNNQ